MTDLVKNFCHMCGHYLNGVAKQILTFEGIVLCMLCSPFVGAAVVGGALAIREVSTSYDIFRGTRCKNGIPNSWSPLTDFRRAQKHYYCLWGYSEEEAEARALEDFP